MKISRYILPTLKEDPSDATVTSHRLMVRAGLIRKESAGMYIYLPLGLKVLQKVTAIVREEMNRSGALEFLMPEMTSAELWKESGRWNTMGPEMFRIKDRNSMEYALAPTHEEAFTSAIRSLISSYRDLPLNAYQINTKFRDEIRPRFGVMRSKEFIMKDAYSFDMDEQGLDESYQTMRKTYRTIFKRCSLETIPVEADTGAMGGSQSEEFMVASEIGEEVLLICESCGYKANQEKAEFRHTAVENKEPEEPILEVDTPDVRTIDDLTAFFKCGAERFLKSIIYTADGEHVMAVVPGNREINEHKLKNHLRAAELELASDSAVEDVTGAPVGFAGPVTEKKIRMVFDISVKDIANGITGANKRDTHFTGVNPGRDFTVTEEADITIAEEGDPCPQCGKAMITRKGIEVGHIFKLGYKYSKSMSLTVLDKNGKAVNPIMGCYGIGVNRTMAAIVEQHHDEKGIVWPMSIAPFQVLITGIAKSEEEIASVDEIYSMVRDAGIEVLCDDRKVSPGFKFADAELIGIPVRITVGKNYFNNNELEIKMRRTGVSENVTKENLLSRIREIIAEEMDIIDN
ncbi:MAG TPA: proline--tRNA ligase [Spirochaetota bacterium]|nr:proline--tRNA ligase [Spirochaetota bacterium]HPQ52790.1 proline--tRNA ligase [Spirochaetota bacterium]